MTSILSAKHRAARRPATSGDAQALLGQDVTPTRLRRGRVNGSKVYLLVILHYLLKNNITFMWGIVQGKMVGGIQPSLEATFALNKAPGQPIGGSDR